MSISIPVGLKRVATLCILRNDSRLLLLKRAKAPHQHHYTPVGGKLDPYESPLQAAIRETYEETGIVVDTMGFCGILTETSPTNYNWIGYVYVAEIDAISPPYCKEFKLEWIEFEHLAQVPTPKTDWYIYQYILNNKKFVFNAEYDQEIRLLSMIEEIENLKLL